MNILHTSDWHLGAELEGLSRADEQKHFLTWLLETMREREVEVLLMAGDIFHHSHPSAAAQAMFYEFIQKMNALPALRHAVFIGGNHDSPSRLEAPAPLFKDRKMTLIGGYNADREEELLVPITGESGEVELVVAAAPYVHETRLRVNPMGKDSEELRSATVHAFESFYRRLGELAKSRWPKVPLVGMGHLTCGGDATEDDYGTALHNVGNIDALPSSIFCPTLYTYVALGHIHRGYRVDKGCANYSGSPLTLRFNASELSERRVVLVDGKTGDYERVAIPLARHLRQIKGTREEVEAKLKAMQSTSELDTWVSIVMRTDDTMMDPVTHFRELAPEGVFVVMVQQHRLTRSERIAERENLPDVRSMTPKEIFIELFKYENEGGEPSENLLRKFDQSAVAVIGGEHE